MLIGWLESDVESWRGGKASLQKVPYIAFIYLPNKNMTVIQQDKGDANTYEVKSDTHSSICHDLN